MDNGELILLGFIVGAVLGGGNFIGMLIDIIKWNLEDRRLRKRIASGEISFGTAIPHFWGRRRLS